MKPGHLTLPVIWRGCTWPSIQLQWLDQDENPINLNGWFPRAFTRHFDLNAQVTDALNGMTTVGLNKAITATLNQGVEDWDWVWLKQGATGATLPPMIKGTVPIKTPVTNPETINVSRIGGGSQYVLLRSDGPYFNLTGRYDLWKDTIGEQLVEMRANGQNQIGMFIWHVSGLTWPDPTNPPTPAGYFYPSRPYVYLHTEIPWHQENPYPFPPDPSKVITDATLSPQSTQNLIDLLALFNELGFEELHVRPGPQGANATLPNTDPVPENDLFANAIPLVGGIIGVTTIPGATVGATRETGEPDGGGEGTVWYSLVGDNHWWSLQISRPSRSVIEAFHGPSVDNLIPDGISNGSLIPPMPCVFFAALGTTYHIRVGVSDVLIPFEGDPHGVPNMPDYFNLSFLRDAGPNDLPVPPWPVQPFPPAGWDAGHEAQFVENSAFMRNVTALIETNKGGLRVNYDLLTEGANRRTFFSHVHRYYTARMWREWSAQFGVTSSCLGSALSGGYGIRFMIDLLKASQLPLPGFYAIDTYGNEIDALTRVFNTLSLEGEVEAKKKIYIFETFYNDNQIAKNLRTVIHGTGLNFGGVHQWPIVRGHPPFPFPDGFTKEFDQYFTL